MKNFIPAAVICLAAAMAAGCASKRARPVYHAGDEKPPGFLIGPATPVLTNLGGFSAHVAFTTSTGDAPARTANGILLGRDGRLIYQPVLEIKKKRAKTEGGLFFIWDENLHSGYVISEALQGYAPLAPPAEATGPLRSVNEGEQGQVDGHPCHRTEAEAPMPDGHSARLIIWRADDLRRFPVRIEEVMGPDRMTVDFSEILLEYPNPELFNPPDGFTAYSSAVAMMNELILRDASYTEKKEPFNLDEPQDVRTGNYHPTIPSSP